MTQSPQSDFTPVVKQCRKCGENFNGRPRDEDICMRCGGRGTNIKASAGKKKRAIELEER